MISRRDRTIASNGAHRCTGVATHLINNRSINVRMIFIHLHPEGRVQRSRRSFPDRYRRRFSQKLHGGREDIATALCSSRQVSPPIRKYLTELPPMSLSGAIATVFLWIRCRPARGCLWPVEIFHQSACRSARHRPFTTVSICPSSARLAYAGQTHG